MIRRAFELSCLLLLAPACAAAPHDTREPEPQPTARVQPLPGEYEGPQTSSASIDPIVAQRMDERMTSEQAVYTDVEPFVEPTLRDACGWKKPTFYFPTDESDVGLVGEVKMNALATCLNNETLETEPVAIFGYADPRGGKYDNLELGLERANAVKSELVAQGVDAGRIQTYSRGEYVADEDSPLFEERRGVVKLDR